MKRAAFIFVLVLLVQALSAQNLTMSLKGRVEAQPTDLDAKTYYPIKDNNDNLCALIKVTVTNPLKNPLVLNVGGLGVVKREEKEDGEIWFYVPAQVRNLNFSCMGYSKMDPVPVTLKEGTVYRLTIVSDAVFSTVTQVTLNTNFLKMQIDPPDAVVRIGQTQDYEITNEMAIGGSFVRKLDYGTYYYRVEHGLYEPREGVVTVSASNKPLEVKLAPAYNMLEINSFPESGASVFVNGEFMGQTPLKVKDKIKKGNCSIRLMLRDYHQYDETVALNGDGSLKVINADLSPQYGTVTCTTSDPDAEIWVDQDFKGKGSWTGRLSSSVTHVMEARKANHQSQSKAFSVEDGQVKTETVGAPVPLYASLSVVTDPVMSKVMIDGNYVGEAPLLTQVLMGEHTVVVAKEGYVSKESQVTLRHNEEKEVRIKLEEGRIYVPVTLKTMAGADIYVDGEKILDGSVRPAGIWSGELPEGLHAFSSSKPYHDDGKLTYTVKGPSRVTLVIPSPVPQKATLSVSANTSGVSVYVDDAYAGITPYTGTVDAGERVISVKKDKFLSKDSPRTVTFNQGDVRTLVFDMRKDRSQSWIRAKQSKCTHFGELQYGFGLPLGNPAGASVPDDGYDDFYDDGGMTHYAGLEYSYVKSGMGFRTSMMYGINNGEFLLSVGPAIRLTKSWSDLDLQFYLGVGGGYAPDGISSSVSGENVSKFGMAYDGGFRFAFRHPNYDDFCWYSFSAGAKYFNDKIIPTFGVSLFPGGIFRADGLYEEQTGFARTFVDFVMGYGTSRETFHFGATFAHVRTRLGYYGTIMYEFDDVGSLALGPVFRLTSDDSFLDLQLYGGIGLNTGYEGTYFLGDTGLRFGWRSHSGLGLWNFNLGCMFFGDEVVPTVGFGFGISLIALAGLLGVVLGA